MPHAVFTMPSRRFLIVFAVLAACAGAQTPPPPLDLRLPQEQDAPALGGADEVSPGVYIDDSTTSVHGSFTSGIGYSKNFGTSTINAADLDVTHQGDDGKTVDLHIGVMRSTGLPTVGPRE